MLELLLYILAVCVAILQAISAIFASLSHFAFEVGSELAGALTIYFFVSITLSVTLLIQGRPFLTLAIATTCLFANIFIASKCQ